jgi:hypothetical protein
MYIDRRERERERDGGPRQQSRADHSKSNFRRLMRRQNPPRQRVARFGNHVDVRQAGLLHFPARFRLVFTVCFVPPLRFRWRAAPRFSRRVGDVSSSAAPAIPSSPPPSPPRLAPASASRRDILATSDTSLAGARLSQYIPLSSARHRVSLSPPRFSSFLPSFLPSFFR